MKRIGLILIGLALLVAGGFAIVQARAQKSRQTLSDLQTVSIKRGELITMVGATGVVRANQTAILTWQTTGRIEQVTVSTGDQVPKGEVLATLAQTSLPQTVILAQADLVNARKALDDLLNSRLQQAQAMKAVEDARQALEDAQDPSLAQARALKAIAEAQKAVENAERHLNNLNSPAKQADIDAAKAQVVLAQHKLDQAKERFEPYENKPEDNLIRANLQSQLAAAQQEYDAAVRKLNNLQGTASETDLALAEADLVTAQAQLAQAQREWERVKDGPDPAEISLLEAQLEDALREWERLKDGPDPDDIAVAQARIAAAEATVNLARLTAPFDATVSVVSAKPGDQVAPGTVAFRLDDLSRLLVDVQVSEVDINRVASGQPVTLTFDAILSKEYHGIVTEVGLVGTSNQGVVEFTVAVELTDADEAVKPGMTAAVNIITGQLEDVLLVPNRAVRIQNGQRVVYIIKNGEPEAVPITLGASSETMSQVIEGELQVGDQVILNPPTEFQQDNRPPFLRR